MPSMNFSDWSPRRRVVFVVTVFGGVALLGLAVWPGALEDALFAIPWCILSLPALASWFLPLIGLAAADLVRKTNAVGPPRSWWTSMAGVTAAVVVFLWLHVPQRLAVALLHSRLEELAAAVPPGRFDGDDPARIPLKRQAGPYQIDLGGADAGGGVYLRTHIGPDGIGPDRISYGFAFRPNGPPTPFGSARYRHRRLIGSWYAFAVSDDW